MTPALDIVKLLATDAPTQMQGNPYLIGPPGYAGGNPYYGRAHGSQYCNRCLYTLGNGVPTNGGRTPVARSHIRSHERANCRYATESSG